jgi:hypothetical protein
MNAATKLKPAAEPAPAVLPEQIRQKLSEAKARFGALTTRQMELAEKSVQSPAVEKEYFEVCAAIEAADADVQRLTLAISSMDRRATEQLKAAEAAEIRSLQGRVVDMLEQRLEAAREFEAGITTAVAAMRRLAALSKSAWKMYPGQQPEHGALFGGEELNVAVAGELFRIGGVVSVTGGTIVTDVAMALPAPRAPTLASAGQPSLVPSLVTQIEHANTFCRTLLGAGG